MNPILIIIPIAYIIFKILSNKGNLKPAEATQIMSEGGKIIDVRSTGEFKSSHSKKAINIQHDKIVAGVKKNKISKETPLILYCASGMRSSAACNTLKAQGYTMVYNAKTKDKMDRLLG